MPRRRPRYSGTHPRRFEERYKERALDAYPAHTAHLREKGHTPAGSHLPVMVAEVLERLAPQKGETFVDCTLGYGGHAAALLERIAPVTTPDAAARASGRLIGLDVDGIELPRTVARLARFGEALHAHRMRFAGIGKALALEGLTTVDGILADLGVSSMQLDDPTRGFSVKRDGPLDLRMDDRLQRTGAQLLATIEQDALATALTELADEPDAESIARTIVEARAKTPIARTGELAALVFAAKGITRAIWREEARDAGRAVNPAARTFQALRMLLNDELGNLRALLRAAPSCLKPGGRFVVISFHRGEDALVKESLRAGARDGVWSAIAEEPLRPTPEELRLNPRASSARLRFAVRSS
ncbi:MAG: 16S rRNA (cytosine(1402)-N(4))-methyltransferase RsmH [Planctomycetes bacterium]|nr:16S rRNA (cytosine(1402)-N(4))-methyltransferase RsmH [Planctomycetota bacterium]